jgi:hypothetical protein
MARGNVCNDLGDPPNIGQKAQNTFLLHRVMRASWLGK